MLDERQRAEDSNERVVRIGNKVILNVGGVRHETFVGTLRNIPDTRLYSLTNNNPTQVPEFDPNSGEFFFDRHPLVFAQILNYYRTGKLHCPNDVCGPVFEEELAFWGLEDASIETCCWMNYKKHGEAQANLSSFDRIVEEAASEHEYTFHEEGEVGVQMRSYRQAFRKCKSRIWVTLEEPSSSLMAKIIAMMSMLLIITSVIVSSLETMEYFSRPQSTQHRILRKIEIVCIIWFTVEIFTRLIVCPSKRKFLRQIMNWLDFASIIPFYIQLFLANSDVNSIVALRIIRLIRVFRVFKLSRHSYSLQILGHTLRASLSELFLLGFFLTIGVVVFSTLMFYAEHESKSRKFSSIPAGFWWAVVTMTTLGYGDIVPDTLPGKIVGTACAICGVLTIALPIPVIVSNFSLYYSHAKAKQKSSQRKRPLIIGAANALKVIDPFLGSRATNLRLSAMSENASCMSPSTRVRAWPKIALDMGWSSFDSSEPPATPATRRRLSKFLSLHNNDQAKSLDNSRRQCSESKTSDETSPSGKFSNDFTKSTNVAAKDWSTQLRNVSKGLSSTSNAMEEHCEENLAKGSESNEMKKCDGAYDNIAVEQHSDNENTTNIPSFQFEKNESDEDITSGDEQQDSHHSMLPKIEIICNSSASQMSGSTSDGKDKLSEKETSMRKSTKKIKKKLQGSQPAAEKATSSPTLTALGQGFSGKNLPGRMGRRGSVFVVGFLGKRWQAKAAKGRMNRRKSKPESIKISQVKCKRQLHLLQVSPSISRLSTPNDDTSRRTSMTSFNTPISSISSRSPVFRYHSAGYHQSLPESNFHRRSSCPALQPSQFPENVGNTTDFNVMQNDCNEPDRVNDSLVESKWEDLTVVEDTEDTLNTKQPMADTKNREDAGKSIVTCCQNNVQQCDTITFMKSDQRENESDTKHVEFDAKYKEAHANHNGVERTSYEVDTAHYEEDQGSTEFSKTCPTTKHSEMKREFSEDNLATFHYEANKTDRKLKEEEFARKNKSLKTSQSDSSLKAYFDGTVRRSSSPLIRQKALLFNEGQEFEHLDDSENEMQDNTPQNGFTNYHFSQQTFKPNYHKVDGKCTCCQNNMVKWSKSGQNDVPSNEFTASERSPWNNEIAIDAQRTGEAKSGVPTNTTIHKNANRAGLVENHFDAKRKYSFWENLSQKTLHCDESVEFVNEDKNCSNLRFSNNSESTIGNVPGIESSFQNENTPFENKELNRDTNSRTDKTGKTELSVQDENKREDELRCTTQRNFVRDLGEINESPLQDDQTDLMSETNYCVKNGLQEQLSTNQDKNIAPKYESIHLQEFKDGKINTANGNNPTNNLSQSKGNVEFFPENVDENQNVPMNGVDWKHPNVNPISSAYTDPHYPWKTSINYQMSTEQSTLPQRANDFEIGTLRRVEAQDSGICCRSSLDSVSSFTERIGDRGILKTISEVEHDYDYRNDMLLFQPFSSAYYEKSRSHVLEIRDETAV